MLPTEQIKFKCAELAQALELDTPGYKTILREMHENIKNTPELLYVLDDKEISQIVAGLSKFSGIEIAAVKSKEKITKAQAAKLGVDDV
jgi:hypothetical protein